MSCYKIMNSMTSQIGTFTLACFLLFGAITGAAELPATEAAAAKQRLLPTPKQVVLRDGPDVVLDKTLTVNVELAENDANAQNIVGTIFQRQFGVKPNIVVSKKDDVPADSEAYRIRAAGKTVTLSAADVRGIRHALSTLRQLAEVNRDGVNLVSYWIPETEIDDAPAMTFRGLHLCWFPETRYARIEQAVRLAAYYKFNYVVIEFWGTFPSTKHPKLCWQEFAAKPEELKRLVAVGKELGITLIPQFNLFGHAPASRGGSAKHTPLDRHPEYQPIYEPDGWVWCLSNPATRTVLTDIVLEMMDTFEQPPYFHIGFDESWEHWPQCRRCLRSDSKALLLEHLLYFHKLLADKKCRMMMWHDMLISQSDARWQGYYAFGNQHTVGVVEKLPRDIICDWQYRDPKEGETWPTMRYFKELGFTVLACPWDNTPGMRSQGRTIADAKLDGMLCTTWNHQYGDNMYKIFSVGGQVTWCESPPGVYPMVFGTHLRQIGWDIPVKDYRDSGHVDLQVPRETFQGLYLP